MSAHPLPSEREILRLVDWTEKRALALTETHRMRLGITFLLDRIRRLTAELRVVTAQRDAALLAAGSDLAVECEFCGAPVGERCRSMVAGEVECAAHTARLNALRRLGWAS